MFNMARGMFSAEKRAQSDVDYETWKASSPGMSVVAQAMQEMAVRMA